MKLNILVIMVLFVISATSFAQEPTRQEYAPKAFIQSLKDKAMSGDSESQQKLGVIYFQGKYAAKNHEAAIKWFKIAAAQNSKFAQSMLGEIYQSQQNYTLALAWHEKAANQGVALSQLALGEIYLHGLGVNLNYSRAIHWYSICAEQENILAQVRLFQIYSNENSNIHDDQAALAWLTRAADNSSKGAQLTLAKMYLGKENVPRNNMLALKYFYLLSVSENNEEDRKDIDTGIFYATQNLSAEQIADVQGMTREWLERHMKKKTYNYTSEHN